MRSKKARSRPPSSPPSPDEPSRPSWIRFGIGVTMHYFFGFRRAGEEARARQLKVEQYYAARAKEIVVH